MVTGYHHYKMAVGLIAGSCQINVPNQECRSPKRADRMKN
jgi:hypothetical protein